MKKEMKGVVIAAQSITYIWLCPGFENALTIPRNNFLSSGREQQVKEVERDEPWQYYMPVRPRE